eukprot:Gb_37621 [translate_table: standard]
MNFFKAAFFDDEASSSKNSDDLDNSDRDGTDGWDNETEEWNVHEGIGTDRVQEQEKTASVGQNSGSSGGIWNFGSLVKSLTSKSEEVIEAYRRDLEEFSTGLKKETEVIREVASRAVKDLPNSLEVGASVAQESLESVGQVIDDFGSSVWRGTTDILAHGKDSILKIDEENVSDQGSVHNNSSVYGNVNVQRKYSRFEAQIRAMQLDSNTYCEEPEDIEDYEAWKSGFRLEDREEEVEILCKENVFMEEVNSRLVPKTVDYETFWTRYFYRLHKLKQAEEARADLVKRAIISQEEEDLSWEVDDEEDEVQVMEEQKPKDARIGDESAEKLKTSEEIVEKVKIGETSAEKPKAGENLVEKRNVSENLAEKPNATEEMADKTMMGSEMLEKPKTVEEMAEKPKTDKNLGEEPKCSESLGEKPKIGEEMVEKAMVNEEIGEKSKSDEVIGNKTFMEAKTDPAESSRSSDFSVVSSKPSLQEEDDLGWDEIEDLSCVDEKKFTVGGSPRKADIRKRISVVEDDEDLSWDVDDDDDDVKS